MLASLMERLRRRLDEEGVEVDRGGRPRLNAPADAMPGAARTIVSPAESCSTAKRSGLDASRIDAYETRPEDDVPDGTRVKRRRACSSRTAADWNFEAVPAVARVVKTASQAPGAAAAGLRRRTKRTHTQRWYTERTAAREAASEAAANKSLAAAEKLFLEFSWRQRRAIAISTFCRALAEGEFKSRAYCEAATAANVSVSATRKWIRKWRVADGLLEPDNWGHASRVPTWYLDEGIRLKSLEWWANRPPKRGTSSPCFRIIFASTLD